MIDYDNDDDDDVIVAENNNNDDASVPPESWVRKDKCGLRQCLDDYRFKYANCENLMRVLNKDFRDNK